MSMRIAILLNARFPTEKAYGIQVMAMARGFAQAGAEVAIVYPRRSSDAPAAMQGVTHIPYGPLLGVRRPWFFHPLRFLGAWHAAKPLRGWKPDIVLANDPVQAAHLARHATVVWDLHDMPDPGSPWRRWLVDRIVRRAAGIVSTNTLKLDLLKKLFGELPPTVVLPNPVSLDVQDYRRITREDARTSVGIPSDQKAVVYAGQLYDWKGVDTLVSAAAFAPRDLHIHIVGGQGDDLIRVRALADALPDAAARVSFHGQRPSDEIPFWLRAADIVAVPNSGKFEISQRDTNPLKLYEAIAAEAPVLASDLPAIREAAGDAPNMRFVPSDDVQAWGRAMGDLMEDIAGREAMRAGARGFHLMGAGERALSMISFFKRLR